MIDDELVCDPCCEVITKCEECESDLDLAEPEEDGLVYWVRCTNEECGNQGEGKGYRLFIGVSPSQIKVYRECKRKWAYGYIDRIRYPSSPAQEFGILGHARNEAWLKDGTPVGTDDVGLVCQQGIKPNHLPTPAPDLLTEHYFEISLFEGDAIMLGYIDCVLPTRPGAPIPIIHDWKFTKDLRWAMKQNELDDDAQVAVYAEVGLLLFESDFVKVRWVYFCGRVNKNSEDGRPRTPRGVRPIDQTYTREQIGRMWQACLDDAAEIVHLKKTVKFAKDVEPDPTHCDAYGGCDHRDYCPLPDTPRLGAALAQWEKTHRRKALTGSINGDTPPMLTKQEQEMSDVDLLGQLRGMKDKNQGFTGPQKGEDAKAEAATETKTEPVEAEAKTKPASSAPAGDNLLADLQNQHGAGNAVNPPKSEPAKKGGGLDALQAMVDGDETGPEGQSSKTDAENTAAEQAAETKADDGDALAALKAMGAKKKPAGDKPAPAETPAEAKTEPTTEPTADKPKPKRARKTKKAPEGGAFVLALDTVAMVKNGALGEVVQLTDLIAPIADAVASSHRCKEHPQGVEHFGLVEFGNGSSELAAATARYLDKTPFVGVLVVDGGSPEGLAVKDVLIRRADVIFRGVC